MILFYYNDNSKTVLNSFYFYTRKRIATRTKFPSQFENNKTNVRRGIVARKENLRGVDIIYT